MDCFSTPLGSSLANLGSYALSHSCQKEFWKNKSLIWFYQRLNPSPCLGKKTCFGGAKPTTGRYWYSA